MFDNFVEAKRSQDYDTDEEEEGSDKVVFGDIDFPDYLSLKAVDIIGKFLSVDEKTRLGMK